MPKNKDIPFQIKILAWFGIIFGSTYLLYSIVSVVLSFLDRTYDSIGENILLLLYGIPIIAVSIALKNKQKWGWIGYMAIFALVLVFSICMYNGIYDLVIGLLSLMAIVGILMPSIRKHYFPT